MGMAAVDLCNSSKTREQEVGCSKTTGEIVKCKLDSWGKTLGLQRAGSCLSLSTKPQREVTAKDGAEHKLL